MPLRAYLVDDEPLAVERLERLLGEEPSVVVTGRATDPAAALEFLSREAVDVLFLDIQMPGMTGFDLLARLPEQPAVIFTTAYDEYALKAFEVNSIDYLLKPIDPEQLRRALGKLERLRGGVKPDWMRQPELRTFLEGLAATLRSPASGYPERIASRVGDRIHVVELASVTHFVAQAKLTYAVVDGRHHSVDHTIAELEQKLDPKRFVRIHRSILLNLDWVAQVNSRFGGQMAVCLKDAARTQLPVARDRARALKERLEL
ncbi:MAG: LytTR family DNA-binding domain-containing protein [Bryobacteraceae bacterium]